jgi:hypothetical protein
MNGNVDNWKVQISVNLKIPIFEGLCQGTSVVVPSGKRITGICLSAESLILFIVVLRLIKSDRLTSFCLVIFGAFSGSLAIFKLPFSHPPCPENILQLAEYQITSVVWHQNIIAIVWLPPNLDPDPHSP